MPIIRTSVGKSKDGKFVVVRTTMTYIKPAAYFEAILANKGQEEDLAAELAQIA